MKTFQRYLLFARRLRAFAPLLASSCGGPGAAAIDAGAHASSSALPAARAGASGAPDTAGRDGALSRAGAPANSPQGASAGASGALASEAPAAPAAGTGAASEGFAGSSAPSSAAAGARGQAAQRGDGGSAGVPSGPAGPAGAGGAGGADPGPGGASGDGSPGSGASRCPGSELLLCESFEADIDGQVWRAMQNKPVIDDQRAARGTRSLHVHTSATGASGLQTGGFLAKANGRYYGRMFVYFDALPTSPPWAHWTLVGANPVAGSDDNSEIRVGGQHDGKIERFGVGTDHGPSGDWTNLDQDPNGAPEPVALGRWLCIEWLHDWDNDETRFYLDGVEHPSLHTTASVEHGGNRSASYRIPELGSVWVGFWNYDQSKPVTPSQFDIWIDEIAFDDERIGCDR